MEERGWGECHSASGTDVAGRSVWRTSCTCWVPLCSRRVHGVIDGSFVEAHKRKLKTALGLGFCLWTAFEGFSDYVLAADVCERYEKSPGLGFCLWTVFEGFTDYVLSADVCERFENVSVIWYCRWTCLKMSW